MACREGGVRGGGDQHQRYGGERCDPAEGHADGRARTGWPPPCPSSSASRPATPAPYIPAVTIYHNPIAAGPHQGVVFRDTALPPYTPSPSTVRASSLTPVTIRAPCPTLANFGAPPPTPSPAAPPPPPPFQPARLSAPAPAPSPPIPTASTAAVANELDFVTEIALAPAAAVAATQVGQPAADKAPEVDAQVSKKGLAHPARPGVGTVGKVMIRATHFLVSVGHYDVSIYRESKSRAVNREVLSELIKLQGKTSLGGELPAYDGRKSLYTAGSLPFESEEFSVTLTDPEKKDKERAEREYKITIRIAGRTDLYHLQQFLQVLDIVLRESPSLNYVTVSRSFFSTTFDHRGDIGEGLECWRGYYQSLRPTQMGLSLNIDISATSFFKPVTVVQFVLEFLNLRDTSRPVTGRDLVKIKKAFSGLRVETDHQQDLIRRYKITWIIPIPMSQLIFPVDERGTRMSVVKYFMQRYNHSLQYTTWPCLQSACKIVDGRRYSKKVNDRHVTNILRATCQRPQQREQSIHEMVLHNKHAESRSRVVIREVELNKLEGKTSFGVKLPAYDGRKSLCSAGSLQERAERECKITMHKMINGATIDNLENGAPKINVKMGEQNIVLERTPVQTAMPFVSEVREVIAGADATAYAHGEDSALSTAPVVASMDRLEIAKYGGLTSAQPYMQEVLEDLFNLSKESQRVNANGGQMNELLITFRRKTGRRPERIVFRDGVNEGQFCQVLLHESDRIRKACATFEDEYIPPVNFAVDQKNHRTRLFPKVHVRHVTLNGNLNSGAAVAQEGPPHDQPKLGPFIQLFVDLNGRRVPIQPKAEATLGSAVAEAMLRTNCQLKDFYVVHEQRPLDLDQAIQLQKILPNSTVQVRPRVRGGVDQIEMSFKAVKFKDRIQSFTSEELFEERTVKAELLGLRKRIRPGRTGIGKEHVMRKFARQIVHQLFEMIHLLHLRGISLNGSFRHEHVFYLPLLDSYVIPEAFIEANGAIYAPFGYEQDMNALGRILEKIFSWKFNPSKRGVYPVHVQHLIETLKSLPVGARDAGAFHAFLRNHVAMLSPGAVQGLILEVHHYIKYQPENLQKSTCTKLGFYRMRFGNVPRWTDVPGFVACFNEVHTNRTYTARKLSWFDFLRNFVSHPNDTKPPNFTMEEVDLAFAYHFDEGLPEFFCDLVMCSTFVSSHTIESVFDRDYFNMKFFKANAESIASTSGS